MLTISTTAKSFGFIPRDNPVSNNNQKSNPPLIGFWRSKSCQKDKVKENLKGSITFVEIRWTPWKIFNPLIYIIGFCQKMDKYFAYARYGYSLLQTDS